MNDTARSLEQKLNEIIDAELAKGTQADVRLILACCDGLLRLDDVSRYQMTAQVWREKLNQIVGASDRARQKRKTVKTLLIAAAVAALLALAALGYAQVKYHIFHFSDHSTVRFPSHSAAKVYDLTVGYVPDGFVLEEDDHNGIQWYQAYAKNELYLTVSKEPIRYENNINTEHSESKTIKINEIEYIVFGDDLHGRGILWIDDPYEYSLSGNLSEEELLKIAVSVR